MGTCGISAGARDVMGARLKEIENLEDNGRHPSRHRVARAVQSGSRLAGPWKSRGAVPPVEVCGSETRSLTICENTQGSWCSEERS
jgi:hypothetical protein